MRGSKCFPPHGYVFVCPRVQVNNAFSVEKGDSALAFTTRDRVSKEEVE